MTDTIPVTASLRMKRPVHIVRAQYRDIDHHIRNNVHPGIHYEWEPSQRGERKIRTTFRILGVPQYDVSSLEDAADGSFVIRYLEGSNAGMVLVHRFVPVDEDETQVELSAHAPSTLGRKLLGPLFIAGAQQVMKRALREDKWDLEQGGFRADEPRGNVEAALAPLAQARSSQLTERELTLELACLFASANGPPTAAQRMVLERAATLLTLQPHGWLARRLSELESTAQSDQLQVQLSRLSTQLGRAFLVRHGLRLATTVAMISDGLSQAELAALHHVCASVDLGPEMVAAAITEVDTALGRGGRQRRNSAL